MTASVNELNTFVFQFIVINGWKWSTTEAIDTWHRIIVTWWSSNQIIWNDGSWIHAFGLIFLRIFSYFDENNKFYLLFSLGAHQIALEISVNTKNITRNTFFILLFTKNIEMWHKNTLSWMSAIEPSWVCNKSELKKKMNLYSS